MAVKWTNAQIIKQLNSGKKWNGNTITFAFPSLASGMYSDGEAAKFRAVNEVQQAIFLQAIQTWADLIPQTFQLTTQSSNIEFGFTSSNIGYAHAYFPDNGSAWFLTGSDVSTAKVGSYGFMTIMHEIGHALGLNHMGNYNGAGSWKPSSYQDSHVMSIMSYFGPGGGTRSKEVAAADWIAADGREYSPQTPMLNDVMAIQSIYGASTTTRSENTVYGFSSNVGGTAANLYDFTINKNPILTIFDSGGVDTLNLSGWSSSSVINLEAGGYSSGNDMTNNIAIAYGSVIENAIGGSGNDSLTGNSSANLLDGGSGNDTLYGGAGDDNLVGGVGDDIVFGGEGQDTANFAANFTTYSISYDPATGSLHLTSLVTGNDSLTDVEFFQFADGSKSLAQLLISDKTAPTLSAFSPSDDANEVALSANLELSFSEYIKVGSGNILIYKADGSLAQTISVNDTTQVTVHANKLTINPASDFALASAYYLSMASGVVTDLAGNAFAGIADKSTYNYSTLKVADLSAPLLLSTTPVDKANDFAPHANIVLTFNETVVAGQGDFILYHANGSVAESISVTDAVFVGNTVTLNPLAVLAPGSSYTLGVGVGVIKDLSGNSFAGLGGLSSFSFTTLGAANVDDYPFTSDTNGVITVNGTPILGVIETAYDGDMFKVELVAGKTYLFSLDRTVGGLSDPHLLLYGSTNELLAFDDDHGKDGNAQIRYVPVSSGTYYLAAMDFTGGAGAYTLGAVEVIIPPDDFGANTETTGVLVVGGQATGDIERSRDEDWFKIYLQADSIYVFELLGTESDGGSLGSIGFWATPYLNLKDSEGKYLRSAYTGGDSGDPKLSFAPATSGYYFLSASEMWGVGTGTYTLKASISTISDDYANTVATKATVDIGGQTSGNIEIPYDQDWFKVTLTAGTSYVFEILTNGTGGGALGGASGEHPKLDLFEAWNYGSPKQSATAGGVSGNPLMSFTPSYGGDYFLSVSELNNKGIGAYIVKASVSTVVDDYGNDRFTKGVLAIGGEISGNIDQVFDQDWLKVKLRAGTTYVFEVLGADGGGGTLGAGNTVAALALFYGGNDVPTQKTQDGGRGGDPLMSFTPTWSGDYYLSVYDFARLGTGSYTLKASISTQFDDYGFDSFTNGILAVGSQIQGDLELPFDHDWLRIVLEAGTRYEFALTGADGGGGTLGQGSSEAYLTLFGDDGSADFHSYSPRHLSSTMENGKGGDPFMSYTPNVSGDFFLQVSDLQGGGVGSYTLSAAVSKVADDYSGYALNTKGIISVGGQIYGNLELANDQDCFRVYLQAGTAYTFQLLGKASQGGTLGWGRFDTQFLRLMDRSGDYAGDGLASAFGDAGDALKINYTVKVSGHYFLNVSDLMGSGTGTYLLKANETGQGSGITSPTGVVSIDGIAQLGQTLNVSTTLADADGMGALAYQWKADGIAITGATTLSLKLNAELLGKVITVQASFVDGKGTAESVASGGTAKVTIANAAPTGAVSFTGNLIQGQTLTASNTLSDADGLGLITYQWKANGINIVGASGKTLSLKEAQVGKAISVIATYQDGHGVLESGSSASSGKVANVNDIPYNLASIAGSAVQGETIKATPTVWDADEKGAMRFQWNADGIAISGAINEDFLLTEAQVGKMMTYTISYIDGHGTAETVTSSPFGKIANLNDLPTGKVEILGSAVVHQTLTATSTLADLDGMGSISYRWLADDVEISGQVSNSLTITNALADKKISVSASYTDGHGTVERVTSSPSAKVYDPNIKPQGNVIINGSALQGQTLSATNTLSDADGIGTLSYQWRADGNSILGATSKNLTLTEAHVGKAISVIAGYLDLKGNIESVSSASSALVANLNDAPTGTVSVSGVLMVGQTIVATSAIADLDGLGAIIYRWVADGSLVSISADNSFLLGSTEAGKTITVSANYVDGHGTSEAVSSVRSVGVGLVGAGTASDDILNGRAGNDILKGEGGNDVLTGGGGNDVVDGGAGIDTASFSGKLSDYRLSRNGSSFLVQDTKGSDGTDTVSQVERLKFADMTINTTVLSQSQTMPKTDVQRLMELYVAFFNRVPDANGMSYWMTQMAEGQSTKQIADTFYSVGVLYSSLTGFSATMSNAEFINVVYKNVLGRADGADAEGLKYWEAELSSGRASHGSLVSNILTAAHNFKGDASFGYVADLLDNKLAVAEKFALQWGLNYNSDETSIIKGMAIANAVTPTSIDAAIALIGVSDAQMELHLV